MRFEHLEKELKSIGFIRLEDGSFLLSVPRGHLSISNLTKEKLSCFEFRSEYLDFIARRCFASVLSRTRAETLDAVNQAVEIVNNARTKDDIKKWVPSFRNSRNFWSEKK